MRNGRLINILVSSLESAVTGGNSSAFTLAILELLGSFTCN